MSEHNSKNDETNVDPEETSPQEQDKLQSNSASSREELGTVTEEEVAADSSEPDASADELEGAEEADTVAAETDSEEDGAVEDAEKQAESEEVPEPRRRDEGVEKQKTKPIVTRKQVVVALISVVAVIAVLAVVAWFFPVLKVRNIEVEGNAHLEAETIVEASGIEEGENLLRVATREAATNVVGLQRIREATVNTSWPSTVVINVQERRVVAFMDSPDGILLVDEAGQTFTDGEPPTQAVRIDAEPDQDLAPVIEVAAALTDFGAEAVEHIAMDGSHAIRLVLHDGRTVFWGTAEDNENKAIALEAAIKMEGEHFNITDPNMITVR